MDQSLIIAIAVIITLAITFMVSFVLYHRDPPPEGCEDLKISPDNCKNCSNIDCSKNPKHSEE